LVEDVEVEAINTKEDEGVVLHGSSPVVAADVHIIGKDNDSFVSREGHHYCK